MSGSKFLINVLHRLGLSVSYDEIYRYKHSVVQCDASAKPNPHLFDFVQYAADNVDHDVCSLDGLATLHAMGIVSISYHNDNTTERDIPENPVPRMKILKAADVATRNKIPVLPCTLNDESMSGIAFQPQFHAAHPYVLSTSLNLDMLWHIGWFLQNKSDVRPNWAGFNSSVLCRKPVVASHIQLQPILDCNPNEPASVYSTLLYVIREAQKLNIDTPVILINPCG